MVWINYNVNFEFDVNILGCCVNVFFIFWLCEVIYNGNKFWNFVKCKEIRLLKLLIE